MLTELAFISSERFKAFGFNFLAKVLLIRELLALVFIGLAI